MAVFLAFAVLLSFSSNYVKRTKAKRKLQERPLLLSDVCLIEVKFCLVKPGICLIAILTPLDCDVIYTLAKMFSKTPGKQQ